MGFENSKLKMPTIYLLMYSFCQFLTYEKTINECTDYLDESSEGNETDTENDANAPDIEPENPISSVDGKAPECEEPTDFDQFFNVTIVFNKTANKPND